MYKYEYYWKFYHLLNFNGLDVLEEIKISNKDKRSIEKEKLSLSFEISSFSNEKSEKNTNRFLYPQTI